MKIYTKTGDKGETSFTCGERVKKNDCRIEAYGTLDELNAVIGTTIAFSQHAFINDVLNQVQHDIFTMCAELAAYTNTIKPERIPQIKAKHVEDIEKIIDKVEAALPKQKSFILPGGTQLGALLHLCRTVTRRAERTIITLSEKIELNPELLMYINRISDMFHVLSRLANNEANQKEQQPIYKYFDKK
ncbi:TPA: cob(I)yrinic acid a,c-diamide adenosyltransferase [Candidatus Woesearchaeota archaeon]|nr:cob(I)yrinic acid a,c-diamide adenosyltransferase [Candidatus Woesearchaeota archaeon]